MAPFVLHPPSNLSPAEALAVSQQAPSILRASAGAVSSSPLASLLSGPEDPELWLQYENLIVSCLRTGDDLAANACLRRLANRFGAGNERVQALRGLVREAEAKDNGELERVLKEYDEILEANDTSIVCPPAAPAFSAPCRPDSFVADTLPSSRPLRSGGSRSCGPWGASPTRRQR